MLDVKYFELVELLDVELDFVLEEEDDLLVALVVDEIDEHVRNGTVFEDGADDVAAFEDLELLYHFTNNVATCGQDILAENEHIVTDYLQTVRINVTHFLNLIVLARLILPTVEHILVQNDHEQLLVKINVLLFAATANMQSRETLLVLHLVLLVLHNWSQLVLPAYLVN